MSVKTDLVKKKGLLFSPQKEYKHISFFELDKKDILKEKERIIKYLDLFDAVLFTSEKVFDQKEKKYVDICDNIFFDGTYEWSASEKYHFEKYDMPLNKDFINHCLNK